MWVSGAVMVNDQKKDVLLISLLGIAHGVSHFFHLVIPPLIPWIKPEFGLSYSEIGAVVTAFFIVSSLGQAASGFLVDSWGAKRTLFLGTILLALGGFVLAVADSYWMLFASSILSGLGNSVFHPTDYSIINRCISTARLSYAFSIHAIVGNIGWAVAPVLMISVANVAGWRMAALSAALIGSAVIVLLAFFHKEFDLGPAIQTTKSKAQGHGSKFAFLGALAIWLCFFFFFFNSFAFGILQNFSPTIFHETYGLSLETATAALTAYLVANAVGVLFGGWVAKRFVVHGKVVAFCIAISAATAILMATQWLPGYFVLGLMTFMGLGVGIATPSRDMLIRHACLSKVGQDGFGRVYGFTYCGMDVGQTLSPLIAGPMLDAGYFAAALVLVAVMQFGAVFTALGVKEN